MKVRQRQRLQELMDKLYELSRFKFGMDGESLHRAFEMARAYKDIADVVYGVLMDFPENDYLLEDLDKGNEAMERLNKICND